MLPQTACLHLRPVRNFLPDPGIPDTLSAATEASADSRRPVDPTQDGFLTIQKETVSNSTSFFQCLSETFPFLSVLCNYPN